MAVWWAMTGPTPIPAPPRAASDEANLALWRAVQAGAGDLEAGMARVGQVVALIGLVVASYFAVVVSWDSGVTLGVFALWTLVWFTLAHQGIRRGYALGVLRWVNPLVEVLVPGYALLALVLLEEPAYALGSWVPPVLFSLFLAASILRLRPELPFIMGAACAAEYGLIYVLVIQPRVQDADPLLYGMDVQVVRMCTLLLMGAVGSGAVYGLRSTISAAGKQIRQRDLFGKYRLGEVIASGGMGTVFDAVYCPEGGFQRRVAVKRIHPHLASDLQFLRRFRAEARLSARLAHPNIVGALDFGRMDDNWFFAMEFVDGPTLKEVAEHYRWLGEPVDTALVAHIGREILSGLEFAHAVARDHKGRLLRVVHRDLSPSNLLVDRSGQVKISDFGVARALRRKHDLHTHHIVGKPAYMAPEQLKNGAIDARFDLFSVGVVLWELVCNRRLFLRDNEAATMMAVLDCEVPPVSTLRPELGTLWDGFFEKALAVEREDRFGSAAEMSHALALLQDELGVPKPTAVAALIAQVSEEALPELDLEHTGPLLDPQLQQGPPPDGDGHHQRVDAAPAEAPSGSSVDEDFSA